MIEKMEECGPVLSIHDIELAQVRMGVTLPEDYKAFPPPL